MTRLASPLGFMALARHFAGEDLRCEREGCGDRAVYFCSEDQAAYCVMHEHHPGIIVTDSCCRTASARDFQPTGALYLHGWQHPTIFGSMETAAAQATNGEIREFDLEYLPVATYDLQQRAEAYERMADYWMQRAGEVFALLKAGESHAPPRTQNPRRKPRKRCPGCGGTFRPGEHDVKACRAVTDVTRGSTTIRSRR